MFAKLVINADTQIENVFSSNGDRVLDKVHFWSNICAWLFKCYVENENVGFAAMYLC